MEKRKPAEVAYCSDAGERQPAKRARSESEGPSRTEVGPFEDGTSVCLDGEGCSGDAGCEEPSKPQLSEELRGAAADEGESA